MNTAPSMIDTMRKRKSVRTFEERALEQGDLFKIQEYVNNPKNLIGPFGETGKIEWVPVIKNKTDQGIKLGTYGLIKNPSSYIVGIAQNDKYSLIEYAYTFHKLVLYLTSLGIGTCWMGGTFNRTSFEKEISLGKDEFIPCITPIGYPKEKGRILDKALRLAVKADNKKSWEKLFYDGTFEKTLSREESWPFETPIEMVRLGPSASNKQPWRMVLSEDRSSCHLYIEHTPNYSSGLGYDMQLLDMGIAMCQYELACQELNISGSWKIKDPGIKVPNENVEYIISWE
ncbi:nitroreductase [Bacillus sp. BGMRC 2118]|nr:nitroreductase [Bacillus sp. BGMRC 2118]